MNSVCGEPTGPDGLGEGGQVQIKVEEYDGSYDCLICTTTIRGKDALRCSKCECPPMHVECMGVGFDMTCPQCAQKAVVPFDGKLTTVAAPVDMIDLSEQDKSLEDPSIERGSGGDPTVFTAGQRVQVQNLVKAQEYNGLIGTVLDAAEGGRVGVKLDQVMFVEGSSAFFFELDGGCCISHDQGNSSHVF